MRSPIPTKLNQKLADVAAQRTLPQGILGRAMEWRNPLILLILSLLYQVVLRHRAVTFQRMLALMLRPGYYKTTVVLMSGERHAHH